MGGRHTWPTQLGSRHQSTPPPLPDHAGSIPDYVVMLYIYNEQTTSFGKILSIC
jgi:hypothetical protein